ncbi:Rieske (2Fe-2S) protein [Yoonia vestfoldensis]|uniref:Rieske (2Fe-2S) protein n=1 Tax=Yoonia vestfoldensis TaxID=245188 RepID=UPI00035C099F|nr:Rieske (2Fe-2S) protein [Yoonia vestfoldensis]
MTADHWQAVALSRELRKRPLRVMHDGVPVVLFRAQGGISVLVDRWPHRMMPLSCGRVVEDTLECPYHGWRFGTDGTCVAIPGHIGDLPRTRIARYAVTEQQGAVFVARGQPDALPYTHVMAHQSPALRLVKSSARGRLADVAENILDATHTHFTHKGLLRGLYARRQRVTVDVTGGQDWVEARYTGEDRQDGLVSRLLDGARTTTIGRFRHPGIAELEYWGPRGLVLATTFHLRQADAQTVAGIGWLAGPRQRVVGQIKALAFKPLFAIALAQDRRVLRAASENAQLAGSPDPVIGPLDFLRRDIMAIIAGDPPASATAPRRHQIDL